MKIINQHNAHTPKYLFVLCTKVNIVTGKGWHTCHIFILILTHWADLRPGIEPTNKIFQKMLPKNIIRASQKAQQDTSTSSAALHWLHEQRNIAAHSFVLLHDIVLLDLFRFGVKWNNGGSSQCQLKVGQINWDLHELSKCWLEADSRCGRIIKVYEQKDFK